MNIHAIIGYIIVLKSGQQQQLSLISFRFVSKARIIKLILLSWLI